MTEFSSILKNGQTRRLFELEFAFFLKEKSCKLLY